MSFLSPKPKIPPAPKPPTRDLALENIQDQLKAKRRKGRAANIFAGEGESSALKSVLGA